MVARERDPLRRPELRFGAAFALDPAMESALLAWGWSNPVLLAAWRRIDRRAETTLATTLAEILGDGDRAALLASMGAALSIGVFAQRPALEPEMVALIAVDWLRRRVGLDADLCLVGGVPRLTNIRR